MFKANALSHRHLIFSRERASAKSLPIVRHNITYILNLIGRTVKKRSQKTRCFRAEKTKIRKIRFTAARPPVFLHAYFVYLQKISDSLYSKHDNG